MPTLPVPPMLPLLVTVPPSVSATPSPPPTIVPLLPRVPAPPSIRTPSPLFGKLAMMLPALVTTPPAWRVTAYFALLPGSTVPVLAKVPLVGQRHHVVSMAPALPRNTPPSVSDTPEATVPLRSNCHLAPESTTMVPKVGEAGAEAAQRAGGAGGARRQFQRVGARATPHLAGKYRAGIDD